MSGAVAAQAAACPVRPHNKQATGEAKLISMNSGLHIRLTSDGYMIRVEVETCIPFGMRQKGHLVSAKSKYADLSSWRPRVNKGAAEKRFNDIPPR